MYVVVYHSETTCMSSSMFWCSWCSLLIKACLWTSLSRNALLGALWTVEHQRVCSVVGKTRQLIFLVVIDCWGSDVVCERYLDLKTTTVCSRGFHWSSSGFWYGDSGMKLRSLVFLCSELIQQLLFPFLAPECCWPAPLRPRGDTFWSVNLA